MENRLHNNPPEPAELYAEKVRTYSASANALPPVSDDNEGEFRDLIGYGGDLGKEIETQHKVEKAPHLEAGRKVDAAYKPLGEAVEAVRKALRAKLGAHVAAREERLRAEAKRKADDAARLIREEEERKAREEADVLSVFDTPAEVVDVAAAVAEAKVAELEVKAAARVGSDAGGYTALGLKTKWSAQITDLAALAAHYAKADNIDLRMLLQKLADGDARKSKGAVEIPGARLVSERVM
jgi:hypothetical protein